MLTLLSKKNVIFASNDRNKMKILGIIPSRYGSSRFPGKPLVKIGSKTMIHRVYEQAAKAFENVIVATDDSRIFDEVVSFGGSAVLTSANHQSGTDRCAEALEKFSQQVGIKFHAAVNIQGDEPFIKPEQLKTVAALFDNPSTEIATLVKPIKDTETLFNENVVKVVLDNAGGAIYFSRSPIPFMRGVEKNKWLEHNEFYHHIGVYAYRCDILKKITKLPQGNLELCEKLEQNRWLENGYKIKVCKTDFAGMGVDTPEDLEKILKTMNLD